MVHDPDFTKPLPPPRSSASTVILVVVLCVVGVTVLGVLAGLVVVLIPKGTGRAKMLEDNNNLRQVAAAFINERRNIPLAPDGRVDVYEVLKRAGYDQRVIVGICRSARSGKGPSWSEIQAGDYRNFPYRRHKGPLDPNSFERVPIVWDPEPTKGERLVACNDGSAVFMDEATFQELLRANPGQE